MTSLMGLGAGLHSSGPVQFHAVKCPVYLYTHLQLVSKATIYAQGKLRGVVPCSGSVLGEDKAVRNSSVLKLYRGREPWPRGGDRLGGIRQFPCVHKLYRGRGGVAERWEHYKTHWGHQALPGGGGDSSVVRTPDS